MPGPNRRSIIDMINSQKEYQTSTSTIKYIQVLSSMFDEFLDAERDEFDDDAKPFTWVRHLDLRLESVHRCGKDLRILSLFPNLRSLKIAYFCVKQRNIDGGKRVFRPLCFRGIENCTHLVRLEIRKAICLRDLRGIEHCSRLQSLIIEDEYYAHKEPLDISALCGLSRLKKLCIFWKIPTNTSGIDLSQCSSLEELEICPNTEDLEFLRGIQLVKLNIDKSPVKSLRGLDATNLRFFRAVSTKIRSLRQLRCAPLRRLDIRFTKVNSLEGLDLRKLVELKARGTLVDSSGLPEQAPNLKSHDI